MAGRLSNQPTLPRAFKQLFKLSLAFRDSLRAMPSLDDHGKLGAATIPFYVPILIISFVLILRHGFTRDSGWIFIFIFSIGEFYFEAISQILLRLIRIFLQFEFWVVHYS